MSINANNITDIDDSTLLANTPMMVVEQGGKTIAIPIKTQKSTQFYVCTGYEGVFERFRVSSGGVETESGERVSLAGEYTIIDPAAVGVERRWYCKETIAFEDFQSYKGVTIVCRADDNEMSDGGNTLTWDYFWEFRGINQEVLLETHDANDQSPMLIERENWHPIHGEWESAILPIFDIDPEIGEDIAPYAPTSWKGRPIVMTDKPVFFSYGAGVKSANGFWEQTPSGDLTADTQWNLIGGASVIKADLESEDNYDWGWRVYGDSPDGTYKILYSSEGWEWREDDLKGPWRYWWITSYGTPSPVPTFVYSETGGYFPAETVVSGLTYAGKPPEIGGFYNADATIQAEKFYPA